MQKASSHYLPRLYKLQYEPQVRRALDEDLGRAGDITTDALIPPESRSSAKIVSRREGCIAGLDIARTTFHLLDENLQWDLTFPDGALVKAGATLATVRGSTRSVLSGERVALNFLGRLSGIATETSRMVASVADYPTRVTCTRKTTPGLRALEKYAVRAGGGTNHRFGLDDAVLIKDNHLAAVGSISRAVEQVRGAIGHMVKVQIEVDTLQQLDEVLECQVDAVLLDNMAPATLVEAVGRVRGRLITEASGGVTPDTAPKIAASGVDLISVGWLTHSAPALDVALEIEPS